MAQFDFAGYFFPIFSGTEGREIFHVDAFLGSGFWISSDGHFLTCRHIFEKLKQGQKAACAQTFTDKSDRFLPIVHWTADPAVDIAIGEARGGPSKKSFFSPYTRDIGMGLDVQSFGFMEWEKNEAQHKITMGARLLRGHVVRTFGKSINGLPCRSIMEISFASPNGFSGGPLLHEDHLVGMLYGNVESRLQAYAIDERLEGDKEYKETSYRVHEFGLAHPLKDLMLFIEHCKVKAFV